METSGSYNCHARITKNGRREFVYEAFGRQYVASCSRELPNRKPSGIVSAMAQCGERTWDVTDIVEQRMGPQNDCHGVAGGIRTAWVDEPVDHVSIESLNDGAQMIIYPDPHQE